MKILVIAPNPFFVDRGFSVRVYDQVRALTARGNDILVTAYSSGRDPEGIKLRRTPRLPGYGAEDLGARFSRLYMDAALMLTTLRSARMFKPDVIHAHLHEGGIIGLTAGRLVHAPVLLDVQGSLAGELADRGTVTNRAMLSVIRKLERFIARKADMVAVSSPATGRMLREKYALADEKIATVVDGIDPEMFPARSGTAIREERRRAGIPEGKKVVLYLGILHRYYGTDALLEAARYLINERGRDDLFFVIGGFPERDRYRSMAKRMGIERHVAFPGRVEYRGLGGFLSMADIAVAPKLGGTESSGKLFHYMAAGLPVVCFETELNRAILGDDGRFARLADARDLGQKIADLADNPEAAARQGAALRDKVMKEYTLARTAEQLQGLYNRMLQWKR